MAVVLLQALARMVNMISVSWDGSWGIWSSGRKSCCVKRPRRLEVRVRALLRAGIPEVCKVAGLACLIDGGLWLLDSFGGLRGGETAQGLMEIWDERSG
jgi:hypothetical protein